jgi:hypothetical protein
MVGWVLEQVAYTGTSRIHTASVDEQVLQWYMPCAFSRCDHSFEYPFGRCACGLNLRPIRQSNIFGDFDY